MMQLPENKGRRFIPFVDEGQEENDTIYIEATKEQAIKRRAGRPSRDSKDNSPQLAANFRSDDEVAKDAGVSGDTVRRYIRLTELQPELQEMVDKGKIGLTPAVELSYLRPEEQAAVVETIDSEQAVPSLSQAQRMKKLSQEGKVRNIKQYLLTALYNAPATIGNYYTSKVQHDLYGDSSHG